MRHVDREEQTVTCLHIIKREAQSTDVLEFLSGGQTGSLAIHVVDLTSGEAFSRTLALS